MRLARPTHLKADWITPLEVRVMSEIYNYNFHMQPRILQGILTKGPYPRPFLFHRSG